MLNVQRRSKRLSIITTTRRRVSSLIKQGTPTTTWREVIRFHEKAVPIRQGQLLRRNRDCLFDDDDDCDGKNLADALGVKYGPLRYVLNSDGKDVPRQARAMNIALYPVHPRFYFATMMKPVLDDSSQDKLRSFFTTYVLGRGPIPAIRIGNQPYGVLLTRTSASGGNGAARKLYSERLSLNALNVLNHYHNVEKPCQPVDVHGRPE